MNDPAVYGPLGIALGAAITGGMLVLKNKKVVSGVFKKKAPSTCSDGGCRAELQSAISHLQIEIENKVSRERHDLENSHVIDALADGKRRFDKLDGKIDKLDKTLSDLKIDMAVLVRRG